ncbi:MAG: TonB-dependent receptor [Parvibaculaceae bacterium]|nr:TonB-dependent receptor [Parvibaculaceae bacterium]HBM87578.1 TonB-dependent receptor [Rhodobiaceae bacterium]|tara:strand:- start:1095 stop:3272 length:2178 start_codon:yes stop_codon:yes gene_type:complete
MNKVFESTGRAQRALAGRTNRTALLGGVSAIAISSAAVLVSTGAMADDAGDRVAPISVTATRTPMEAFAVPGMVTVKGADEIAEEIPSNLGDLFDDIPGVTAVGGPRRTGEVPTIRGFSGADIIVTLDGARQNFVSGHDGRAFIDPSFLSELEVVRGSSSALYGSGGTGGVIALRTLTADDLLGEGETHGTRFGLSYRSGNDEFAQRLQAYSKPMEGADIFAGIVARQSDDVRLGNGTELASEDDIISGLVKGTFDLGDNTALRLSWQRFSNDAVEPGNGQVATGTLNDKDIDSETFTLGFTSKPVGQDLVDFSAVIYSNTNTVDETPLTGTSAGVLSKRELDTVGLEMSNTSRFMFSENIGLAVTAGFEVAKDSAVGATGGGVRGGVVTGDQDLFGAFVQTSFTWFAPFGLADGEFSLTPGVRFDTYDSQDTTGAQTSDSQVSPKVTARFAPTPWAFAYGSYGDAFRAPRLDEMFAIGTHFPVFSPTFALVGFNTFLPNTALEAQSTTTWEAGLGFEFEDLLSDGDIFQAKGGYYSTDGENFISLEVIQTADTSIPGVTCIPFVSIAANPLGCAGTTQSVNIADAELSGFELETSYDSDRFRFSLSGQTMETENTATGQPVGVEQADQVTADLRVKLPEFASYVGWQSTFADDFSEGTDTSEHRDSYQIHEVYARWRPVSGPLDGFSFGVTAENLFDAEYQRVSSDTFEEGRSVLVDVTYTLNW